MLKFACFLALFGLSTALLGVGRQQSAGVKGTLQCNGQPAANVLVKLVENDSLGKDDLLAKTKTDSKGYYELHGHAREITNIDPKINIYHDCNDGATPCQRKFTIDIPDKYITHAKNPTKMFDAGNLELAGKFPKESRDCLH